jgi:4-alpha-glucanotransferase
VRSPTSWGVGDFGDLARLADWVGECGGRVVGTLPLLAAFLDEPFEPSPYAPVSRLFWNELFLDVAAVPELADAPDARRLLASDAVREALARLGRGRLVDHRAAMALKRTALEALAAAPPRPARRDAFEAFLAADPRVRDYARYRAAVEARGTTWPAWTGAARAGRLAERDLDLARVRYHCWVQWIAAGQLRAAGDGSGRPVGLYLDLPLGVHGGGYDTWRERDAFAPGVDAGAPPDPFFSGGQSWGFPPLHPERIREAGYRYPIAYLRHHMQVARVLRLDHVMAMHRVYWVPHGFDATDGVYVRHHPEEAYALVSLASHRHRCTVVGENLGTVPEAVNRAMHRHGLLRMHVLQFEVDPERRPVVAAAPPDSLACLNTHDMHPFAGWWAGADLDAGEARGFLPHGAAARERRRRTVARRALVALLRRAGPLGRAAATTGAVLGACLRLLAAGPARIVLLTLEDLWLEERPQNVPGTVGAPNWRRRLRRDLACIVRDPSLRARLRDVDDARRLRRARPDGK